MSNEEFQGLVLKHFEGINKRFDGVEARLDKMETRMDKMETRMDRMEARLDKMETTMDRMEARMDSMETRLDSMETRQNEMFQVVKSIEHSNIVGKAELDVHNIRLAKSEGTFKRIAKVISEELGKASSL